MAASECQRTQDITSIFSSTYLSSCFRRVASRVFFSEHTGFSTGCGGYAKWKPPRFHIHFYDPHHILH